MHAFKKFNTFEEGYAELIKISSNIEDILKDENGEAPKSAEEATVNLLDKISDKVPSVFDEDYPRSRAISVSANEVGYKFAGQLAFGWITNVTDDGIEYKFRVTVNANNVIAKNSSVIRTAAENGWEIVESEKRNFKNRNSSK